MHNSTLLSCLYNLQQWNAQLFLFILQHLLHFSMIPALSSTLEISSVFSCSSSFFDMYHIVSCITSKSTGRPAILQQKRGRVFRSPLMEKHNSVTNYVFCIFCILYSFLSRIGSDLRQCSRRGGIAIVRSQPIAHLVATDRFRSFKISHCSASSSSSSLSSSSF